MSWRGQGGKRAKGRRGEQDPELDNTAWLAELEREAAQADDDEDDWASTLRGRRSSVPPPGPDPPPAGEPSWAPDPGPPDRRFLGMDPEPPTPSSWSAEPTPQDPPPTPQTPGSDWSSWRPTDPGAYGGPPPARAEYDPVPEAGSDTGWGDPADGGWQPAGADTPTGAWSPGPPPTGDPLGPAPVDPLDPPGRDPLAHDPLDQPGHEPDYPALFGELYRRSASQQDPIWEAPPASEPLPDSRPPEPPPGAWPFEETTQSWEPSDRSFVWPSDELPATPADTSAEWERSSAAPWDDPVPQAPPPPPAPPLDETAAWTSPWATRPGEGNGMAAPPAATGPPPDDWAAAIPTDVPAARRAADPSATRIWQPDADAEPGVPLGPAGADPAAWAPRSRASDYEPRAAGAWAPSGADEDLTTGSRAGRASPAAAEEADEPWPEERGRRQPGERRARAWPRVVAIIAWIVLLMVFCWYYVFPWLEGILPENF
jgi:hypothetical protein